MKNNREPIARVVIVAILLLLAMGEIAVVVYFGQDTWYNSLGFILQIIGFYGIGMGFVQKSNLLKNFAGVSDGMTSSDPIKFMAGNFLFLGILSSLVAEGLDVNRSKKSSVTLGCFGQILILSIYPFLFVYFLVHLLLICPFAYIGYLGASAFVESITGAAGDFEWTSTGLGEQAQKVSMKEVIASDPAAAKSFLIGIPAQLLSFILKGMAIFF